MHQERDFLYINALKQVITDHVTDTPAQLIEKTVKKLSQNSIPKADRLLIQIAFNHEITQEKLDEFLNHWDIEAAGTNGAIILAYVMKMHPELKFDAYTGPRLKGLLNYLRFQNLELIGHFSKIGHRLNQQGIIPLIIKGGAMRSLRPDFPRVMGDIDILVRSEQEMNLSKQIIQELGYTYTSEDHSFDVHPKEDILKGILDVHQFFGFLPSLNETLNNEVFRRAKKTRVFSVEVYMPSMEDMFFICLNNLAHNLRNSFSISGIPQTIFDLTYLSAQKDFNWDIVTQNIFITQTEATSYLAVRFIDQIVPNLFPKKLVENQRLYKKLEDFVAHEKFYTLYVHEVKLACKKLKLSKAILHWATFKNYIKVEGQHFFTKRILKHPSLIRLFLKYAGR